MARIRVRDPRWIASSAHQIQQSSTGSDVGVELLFVRILTQNYLFNVTCNSLRRCFAFVVNRAGFETHHGRPRDGV